MQIKGLRVVSQFENLPIYRTADRRCADACSVAILGAMRGFFFISTSKPDLLAFTQDPQGVWLPNSKGPWKPAGEGPTTLFARPELAERYIRWGGYYLFGKSQFGRSTSGSGAN
jgi:hypothetical protein